MLLGEILFLLACGGTAALIVAATAPFWLRVSRELLQSIYRQVKHAQHVLDHRDEEN